MSRNVYCVLSATIVLLCANVVIAAPVCMVKDIAPDAENSFPDFLVDLDGVLYFSAMPASLADRQLWKSDGTLTGTVMVSAMNPGWELVAMNGYIYFRADDGINGSELWRTDGTTTEMVANINTYGSSGSSPTNLHVVGNTLFFAADDADTPAQAGDHGRELWKTDGITTTLVADITPGTGDTYFDRQTDMGGQLYFHAQDTENNLYVSDGTTTTNLTGAMGLTWVDWPLTAANNTVFFVAGEDQYGVEIYATDGTVPGTALLKNINTTVNPTPPPNDMDAWPQPLRSAGILAYFGAFQDAGPAGIYRSDGTPAGTYRLRNDVTLSWEIQGMDAGVAYFGGDDGSGTGIELWRTEGSDATTQLVRDIYPGTDSSGPGFFANVDGTLFFSADDGVNGLELWMSDGTETGTVMVADINPGSSGADPRYMTDVGGRLFFRATDGVNGTELWAACPDAIVDTPSVDFANHGVGAPSDPIEVTLTNEGLWEMNFVGLGAYLSGGDTAEFTVSDVLLDPDPIVPGESRTIEIIFNPGASGTFATDLIIETDDPDEPLITIPVTGDSVEMPVAWWPGAIALALIGGAVLRRRNNKRFSN